MTDAPNPPHRLRRRIAVAALLLLVFCGGLWWAMRPTMDPRLVGTWMADVGTRGSFGLRFKADGSQQESEILTEGRPNWTSVWKWSFSGNLVRQRANSRRTDVLGRMRAYVIDLWDRLRGEPWHFEIVELTERTLKIRPLDATQLGHTETLSYTRVPDDAVDVWKKQFAFPDFEPQENAAP